MVPAARRSHQILLRVEFMMTETQSAENFPAMLRRVLGSRLAPGAATFPDMFAADGVLEYPFAPPGLNTPVAGRNAIVANFERMRKLLRIDGVADVAEIETGDPDMVVLEFSGFGEGVVTKEAYDQCYVSIICLREGRIVRYKDYWNPIAFVHAVKGSEATRALTIEQAA